MITELDLLMGWLLCSLITSIIVMRAEELGSKNPPRQWEASYWGIWLIISVIWPIGVVFCFFITSEQLKDVFLKKRTVPDNVKVATILITGICCYIAIMIKYA